MLKRVGYMSSDIIWFDDSKNKVNTNVISIVNYSHPFSEELNLNVGEAVITEEQSLDHRYGLSINIGTYLIIKLANSISEPYQSGDELNNELFNSAYYIEIDTHTSLTLGWRYTSYNQGLSSVIRKAMFMRWFIWRIA